MAERDSVSSVFTYFRSIVGSSFEKVTDRELLERYADRHDAEAFELLMWRHVAMVQRVCREILRDHHASEDAAQAVFLMLARQAGSIRNRDKVAGWLYRAAYRLSLRVKKRKVRSLTVSLSQVDDSAASVERTVDDDPELKEKMIEAISKLPAKYRDVVILCYLEGLTREDAAKRLGIPTGTVAAHAHRAKLILQRMLSRRGATTPAAAALGLLACGSTEAAMKFVEVTLEASMKYASGQTVLPGVSAYAVELATAGARDSLKLHIWLAACVFLATGVIAVGSSAFGDRTNPPETPIPLDIIRGSEVIAPLPVRTKELTKREISDWERLGAIYGATSIRDHDELFRFKPMEKNPYDRLSISQFSANPKVRDIKSYPGFRIPAGSAAAKRLDDLPRVTTPIALDLREVAPTDADIRAIVKNHELVMLSISGDTFSDASLKEIGSLNSLVHLEVVGGRITDSGIRELPRLSHLTRLHLKCPLVTDDGVEHLAKMKQLTSLSLVGEKLGNVSVVHISSLTKLAQLFFVAYDVTDAGLEPLEKLTDLEFLAIRMPRLVGHGLAHLAKATKLTHLDVNSPMLEKDGFSELKPLQSLKHLKFNCKEHADAALANLRDLQKLECIDVVYSDLSDAGLAEFAAFDRLERLSIFSTIMQGSGFKSLASLENLRELELYCWTDEKRVSLEGIEALGRLKRLESLKIYCVKFESDLMKHLSVLDNVVRLEIHGKNALDDTELKLLQGMKKLKQLHFRTNLTPDAVKELAAMKGLTHLSFISRDLDDDGLVALSDLTDLKELGIGDSKVSDDGIRRLAKRLPNCIVNRATVKSLKSALYDE